ncbi:MAG: RsmD family RNA methyltransferase [Gammaproteobacteria bacterium]|nr:RsmD family RNA methyltransferase [Gammaproteobacteria bacterium]
MGEIRIIGGKWKRSKIAVNADFKLLRPTLNRVRETLFNWLGVKLEGQVVLDAFAGTGALGLESASRGAREVYMVEKNKVLFRHIQFLCHKLDAQEITLFCADVFQLHKPEWQNKFDVVFLDPPFDSALRFSSLRLASSMVKWGGLVYFETNQALVETEITPNQLQFYKQYRAGVVCAYLLVKGLPS